MDGEPKQLRTGLGAGAKALLALALVALPLAALARSSAGRASDTHVSRAATLTIKSTDFHEEAQNGKLLGLVFEVDGQVDNPAKAIDIFVARTDPGPRVCCWWWRLRDRPAGAFRSVVPAYWFAQLQYPLARGTYEVLTRESPAAGGAVQSADPKTATLVPGHEGLLRHAWVSFARNGAEIVQTTRDPRELVQAKAGRKIKQLWVHFAFAERPALRPLVLTWSGRGAGSVPAKLVKNRVDAVITMPKGKPLPFGVWRAVLQANGVPVGELRIRLVR
jgi:hypothetical protein